MFCYYCNRNTALLPISSKGDRNLFACLECYKERVKKGELPPIGELTLQDLKKVFHSIKQEGKELKGGGTGVAMKKINPNLNLLKFGKDLTTLAEDGALDPVIGREKEVKRAIQILSRRMKNNPVFLGDPGVGKTAIAEGIAQKIADGSVPEHLKDKRIVLLDIASVVAGTKYRGEFEDRLRKIIEEVIEEKNIILFIDEIHTLVGAGGAEGAVDASNILKPSLSRGEVQLMGATTIEEYRKHIEKDAALERRFQAIDIKEPTREEAVEILKGLKDTYERYHHIHISDEAVEEAVRLSDMYIYDRHMPDKAIDVMDEAAAAKRILQSDPPNELLEAKEKAKGYEEEKDAALEEENFERAKDALANAKKWGEKVALLQGEWEKKQASMVITKEDVASVVSDWTGIPVQQLTTEEKERIQHLESILKQDVKGQEEAVEIIAKAIRRSKAGLKEPNRPVGAFLLLGPTGVGKTELAKSLAKHVYGSEESMIRVDMSEMMEGHAVSKLIGSPPGYVGYEDDGKLTKSLRRNPYSLVLIDEVEKAHPDVLNIFLQLFEDGRITDGKGRVVSAKNAIFLLTSNAGSDAYTKKSSMGFQSPSDKEENDRLKKEVESLLKKEFRPEFLNRLDHVVMFNRLNKDIMIDIAEKFIGELQALVSQKGVTLTCSKAALEHLADVGYDPTYGARFLKREISKIKDMVADVLLQEEQTKISIGVRKKGDEKVFVVK